MIPRLGNVNKHPYDDTNTQTIVDRTCAGLMLAVQLPEVEA